MKCRRITTSPSCLERCKMAGGLHPHVSRLVSTIRSSAPAYGFKVKVTSGWRSRERQQELYDARASNPYPVARPGRSQHEYGFAVDMVATPGTFQGVLGSWWKSAGGFWSPSDAIHFQVFSPADWSRILGQAPISGSQFQAPTTIAVVGGTKQFAVGASQIQQAVNLISAGQPQLAQTLLRDPSVQLSDVQKATLVKALPPPSTPPEVTPPDVPPPSTPPPSGISIILPSAFPERAPFVSSRSGR